MPRQVAARVVWTLAELMTKTPPRITVIHGPNLNMLGLREPEIYGSSTLDDVNTAIMDHAKTLEADVSVMQSNSEGDIIDAVQALRGNCDGLIINPGGLTHTSVALRDAISASEVKTIEVHISNIHAREAFRATSYISGIAAGVICGLGIKGYLYALDALAKDKI
ncbi:MAG: type II 3-dehydroquinate dehydratase [Pseudomonadota bacterium]